MSTRFRDNPEVRRLLRRSVVRTRGIPAVAILLLVSAASSLTLWLVAHEGWVLKQQSRHYTKISRGSGSRNVNAARVSDTKVLTWSPTAPIFEENRDQQVVVWALGDGRELKRWDAEWVDIDKNQNKIALVTTTEDGLLLELVDIESLESRMLPLAVGREYAAPKRSTPHISYHGSVALLITMDGAEQQRLVVVSTADGSVLHDSPRPDSGVFFMNALPQVIEPLRRFVVNIRTSDGTSSPEVFVYGDSQSSARLETDSALGSASFVVDGSEVVVVRNDDHDIVIQRWNPLAGKLIREGRIGNAAVSPTEDELGLQYSGYSLGVHHGNDGRYLLLEPWSGPGCWLVELESITMSYGSTDSNGLRCMTSDDQLVFVTANPSGGTDVRLFGSHRAYHVDGAVWKTASGDVLVDTSARRMISPRGGAFEFWNLETGHLIRSLPLATTRNHGIAWTRAHFWAETEGGSVMLFSLDGVARGSLSRVGDMGHGAVSVDAGCRHAIVWGGDGRVHQYEYRKLYFGMRSGCND